jgi:hemerythrin-like domain-containing protein
MTSISDFMSNDHRTCDHLFAVAEESVAKGKWDKAAEQFGTFRSETERHLGMEEQTLFVAFETKTGMTGGPTQVMRSEHQQMRIVMDDMAQKLAAKDGEGYLGLSETLMVLMQQHNMKEEHLLYRMMDQTFGEEAATLLERASPAV